MAVPDDAENERASEIAYDALCRQLAFRHADDAASFDVVVLAYSLLTYVTTGAALAKTVAVVVRDGG